MNGGVVRFLPTAGENPVPVTDDRPLPVTLVGGDAPGGAVDQGGAGSDPWLVTVVDDQVDASVPVPFGPLTTAGAHELVAPPSGKRLRLARVTPTFDNRGDASPLARLELSIVTDAGPFEIRGAVLTGRFDVVGAVDEPVTLTLGSVAEDVSGTVFVEVVDG